MQKLATVSQETKQPQRRLEDTDIWGFSNPCVLGIPKCSQDYQIWCTHSTWSLGLWFWQILSLWLSYVIWHSWPEDREIIWVGLIFYEPMKNKKISLQGWRKGSQRFKARDRFHAPCWREDGRGPHDKQCGQPQVRAGPADSPSGNWYLSPTNPRN